MAISGIYLIANSSNTAVYIGQSVDIHRRWSKHRWDLRRGSHSNTHLQHSWKKHGEEKFSFLILEKCKQEQLTSRETFWCNLLRPEYNKRIICDSNYGTKKSMLTRARMSLAKRGSHPKLTPERQEELRQRVKSWKQPEKRSPLSTETKAKISATKIGKRRVFSEQHKTNLRAALANRFNEETFEKRRQTRRLNKERSATGHTSEAGMVE